VPGAAHRAHGQALEMEVLRKVTRFKPCQFYRGNRRTGWGKSSKDQIQSDARNLGQEWLHGPGTPSKPPGLAGSFRRSENSSLNRAPRSCREEAQVLKSKQEPVLHLLVATGHRKGCRRLLRQSHKAGRLDSKQREEEKKRKKAGLQSIRTESVLEKESSRELPAKSRVAWRKKNCAPEKGRRGS